MAEAKRGICPECEREYGVTAAGGMRMHLEAGHDLWRPNCAGVGKPPKSPVVDPLAAARSEGYAQARAEDIAALRANNADDLWRFADAHAGDYDYDNLSIWSIPAIAADYLASLTPTQEAAE